MEKQKQNDRKSLKRKLPSITCATMKKQRDTLPFCVDLWIYIVSNMLSMSSVLSFAQTCKGLYEILPRVIPNTKITVQAHTKGFKNWKFYLFVRHLKVIGRGCPEYDLSLLPPRLESLEIEGMLCAISKKFNCGKLKKVVFQYCGNWITNEFLDKLPKSLEHFSIMWCDTKISDLGLANMRRMKQLKKLLISELHKFHGFITDAGLACLRFMNELTGLDLNLSAITDVTMKLIGALKNLRELNLGHCFCISKLGFQFLVGLSDLEYLNLSATQVSDEELFLLLQSCQHNLQHLELEECKCITWKSFANLDSQQLKYLNLSECIGIDEQVCKYLPKSLVKLNLSGCRKLTDDAMKSLGEMKSLRSLDLTWCNKITDRGIALIPRGLTNLNLSFLSKITKGCVPSLLEMKNLQSLDISETRVPAMPIVKYFKGRLCYTRWL